MKIRNIFKKQKHLTIEEYNKQKEETNQRINAMIEDILRMDRIMKHSGKMPDWAYYQQNGATAQENFNRQIQAFRNRLRDRQQEKQ